MNDDQKQMLYKNIERYSPRKLNKFFINACSSGDLDLTKYLTSQEFNFLDFSSGLIAACINNNSEIICYLIAEKNIKETKHIQDFLQKKANKEVERLFNLRDINNSLNEELVPNNLNNKKMKV